MMNASDAGTSLAASVLTKSHISGPFASKSENDFDAQEQQQLALIFSERECHYFGMPPQSIIDSLGEILLEEYAGWSSERPQEIIASATGSVLSPAQIQTVHTKADA